MKELRPGSLEDLIAGISLYRPGPMDFIPQYIRGKNHPETITYDTPLLEPILQPTYGCIVYQEQVMQIVQSLGGFNLGQSDNVRRAMSEKKASVMAEQRKNFVYGNENEGVPGCIANGIDEQTANKIYDEMTDFAKYAFNKSHAAAYAVVAFQTAWLKYYYPVEFMAALMTSVIDNPGKVAEYIMTCRSMGIRILPPDVNEGEGGFSVTYEEAGGPGSIRYGLNAIRSVGRPVIEALIARRQEGGPYTDLRNLAERLGSDLNKRAVENFIKAGALDSLGGNRRQKMLAYAGMFDSVQKEKKNQITGQMSIFDLLSGEDREAGAVTLPNVPEYEKGQLLAYEKEVLGIYVSGHPLEQYEEVWRRNISALSTDFAINDETGQADRLTDGSIQIIGGILEDITTKYTKTSRTMAFLTIEDLTGSVEVLVFPNDYEKSRELLNLDERLFIRGRVSQEDDKPSKLIAEKIWRFEEVPAELWIRFDTMDQYCASEKELMELLLESQRIPEIRKTVPASRIAVFVQNPRCVKNLTFTSQIYLPESLTGSLRSRFGEENVIQKSGKLMTGTLPYRNKA